jgi:uncharacterized protein YndB with AHSA1/START domain
MTMAREFSIERVVALPATPEDVWFSIATPEGMAGWFMAMPLDAGDESVQVFEPPRHLKVVTPAGPDGSFHAFEYLVSAEAGGTATLRFVHSGMASDDWGDEFVTGTGHGWDLYFELLAIVLRDFPGRPAVYAEAEAPPAPNDEAAVRGLLPGLGEPVTVELPGVGTLEGVVDADNPHRPGFRTATAIIRFHGRWEMGMPIAVGHHDFDTSVDPDALAKGWTAWLAAALA